MSAVFDERLEKAELQAELEQSDKMIEEVNHEMTRMYHSLRRIKELSDEYEETIEHSPIYQNREMIYIGRVLVEYFDSHTI